MHFMSDEEAVAVTRELINCPEESFPYDGYPFQRIRNSTLAEKKMNVIVFIMESWSAVYCGSITGQKSFTPFFDSLANHSLLLTKFYANGQRSIEIVPSIISSVPAVFPVSIIGSKIELSRFRGMGTIFKELGYSTSFHHGARTGSMGFDGYVRLAGFDFYYGKEDVKNIADEDYDGVWGIYDEPFFIETGKNISRLQKPSCSVIFSLSSHDPFKVPENRKNLFEDFVNENELELAVRYSDFSLREFFKFAATQNWYYNTLFIITADHTLFNTRKNFISSFHIPCLLFSPSINLSGRSDKIASQVDILPTIIDLLDLNVTHSSGGKSFFDESKGFAVFYWGVHYVFLQDGYCLLNNLEGPPVMYKPEEDRNLEHNIILTEPIRAGYFNKRLLAYLQTITASVVYDKVYTDKIE